MNEKTLAAIALAATLSVTSCGPAQPANTSTGANVPPAPTAAPETAAKKAPTDLDQFAHRLVAQSAGVKEGEIVLVNGGLQDVELLEDIAVQVRKAGAFPLVVANSDRMAKRMYTDVPEKYDSQTDQLGLKLAQIANVTIDVDSNLDDGLFADTDQKRMAARAKANEPVAEAYLKRVRSVDIGNGLYPTEWRAKRYDMTADELSKIFWGSVNVDYSDLQTRAEQVKAALSSGNEIHITDLNGTDFEVRVQGRPYGVSDGIISPEDMKKGGANTHIYLPAGEVYVTPVPGTAQGKIVRPKDYFSGKEIQDLTLTFAAGKLTSMTGRGPGFDLMKAQYEAAGEGKELFAVVDFGINSNLKLPPSSPIATWVPAGTITVGWGNNLWAGGDNKAPYAHFVALPATTVTMDGKPVIEKGQLKL